MDRLGLTFGKCAGNGSGLVPSESFDQKIRFQAHPSIRCGNFSGTCSLDSCCSELTFCSDLPLLEQGYPAGTLPQRAPDFLAWKCNRHYARNTANSGLARLFILPLGRAKGPANSFSGRSNDGILIRFPFPRTAEIHPPVLRAGRSPCSLGSLVDRFPWGYVDMPCRLICLLRIGCSKQPTDFPPS